MTTRRGALPPLQRANALRETTLKSMTVKGLRLAVATVA
jgi:hypothetical protein